MKSLGVSGTLRSRDAHTSGGFGMNGLGAAGRKTKSYMRASRRR